MIIACFLDVIIVKRGTTISWLSLKNTFRERNSSWNIWRSAVTQRPRQWFGSALGKVESFSFLSIHQSQNEKCPRSHKSQRREGKVSPDRSRRSESSFMFLSISERVWGVVKVNRWRKTKTAEWLSFRIDIAFPCLRGKHDIDFHSRSALTMVLGWDGAWQFNFDDGTGFRHRVQCTLDSFQRFSSPVSARLHPGGKALKFRFIFDCDPFFIIPVDESHASRCSSLCFPAKHRSPLVKTQCLLAFFF